MALEYAILSKAHTDKKSIGKYGALPAQFIEAVQQEPINAGWSKTVNVASPEEAGEDPIRIIPEEELIRRILRILQEHDA